ncbi:MAG: D-tyrosyl-tRNA(Tyr) deacylase [bacterium]|nr:D-tyrosyl-tRNA(Tyr) deacylase [bacterium]
MKAVIQRVNQASVRINEITTAAINKGLLVFLGIKNDDTKKEADWIIDKILNLRVFEDKSRRMNYSTLQINAEILIVSQFTLYGNCQKGRRPGFDEAAKESVSKPLYSYTIEKIRKTYPNIKSGTFGANMRISLENDGPVTFIVEK